MKRVSLKRRGLKGRALIRAPTVRAQNQAVQRLRERLFRPIVPFDFKRISNICPKSNRIDKGTDGVINCRRSRVVSFRFSDYYTFCRSFLYRHFFVQKQFEKNLVKKMLCVFLTVSLKYFEH